jgi:hypothetical protein
MRRELRNEIISAALGTELGAELRRVNGRKTKSERTHITSNPNFKARIFQELGRQIWRKLYHQTRRAI